MEIEDITAEVNEILQHELYRLVEDYFVPEARIKQDLEINSTERMVILDKLEHHFSISIDDYEWDHLRTLEDLYKLTKNKVNEQN